MVLWFFFSSRRRHTRCLSDWSSDVCSSDLPTLLTEPTAGLDPITTVEILDLVHRLREERRMAAVVVTHDLRSVEALADRSEERRVGKECRSGGERGG